MPPWHEGVGFKGSQMERNGLRIHTCTWLNELTRRGGALWVRLVYLLCIWIASIICYQQNIHLHTKVVCQSRRHPTTPKIMWLILLKMERWSLQSEFDFSMSVKIKYLFHNFDSFVTVSWIQSTPCSYRILPVFWMPKTHILRSEKPQILHSGLLPRTESAHTRWFSSVCLR